MLKPYFSSLFQRIGAFFAKLNVFGRISELEFQKEILECRLNILQAQQDADRVALEEKIQSLAEEVQIVRTASGLGLLTLLTAANQVAQAVESHEQALEFIFAGIDAVSDFEDECPCDECAGGQCFLDPIPEAPKPEKKKAAKKNKKR